MTLINQMIALNKIGEQLAQFEEVSAMTDVTGFGLLGHLIEMSEGAGISAELFYTIILFVINNEPCVGIPAEFTFEFADC